jgi:aarF domain-containing kinase
MASWLRVASGLHKVASAAASHASQEGQILAARVSQHGLELAASARTAAAAATAAERVFRRMPAETQQADNIDSSLARPIERSSQTDTQGDTYPIEKKGRSVFRGTNGENEGNEEPLVERIHNAPISSSEQNADFASLSSSDNTILTRQYDDEERYDRLKEGKRVPATRVGRAFGFASLGAGLALGTAAEFASRVFGKEAKGSAAASDENADRLAATLCRMRGAALKLGQMLSIQDETLLPPALSRALEQVRQGADAMPNYQLTKQLESQLGKDWRDLLVDFDELPFAAASIGQVHRATVQIGSEVKDVVMKVQYPGVGNSIESDLRNLQMLINLTGLAPPGLFIEEVMRVGRNELKVECDYLREMENQLKFKKLVEEDPQLHRERFVVPGVYKDLTTPQILTSDYVRGGTIDKVSHLDQDERNRIASNILYLTMQELFVWRFMQTDPNWGNFLYDVGSRTTFLIDFGAARQFDKTFVDGYLRIVCANANRDEETLMTQSHKLKFLTGEENDIMREAHKMSGFTVGEPFRSDEAFDFRGSNISTRLGQHSSAFMQHRLT